MNNSPFPKTLDYLNKLINELEELKKDAIKFDNGADLAGRRVRKKLWQLHLDMNLHRGVIQKQRYYRDAWKKYYGRIKSIDGLEHKEKKYGTISEVVKLQISQKFKA